MELARYRGIEIDTAGDGFFASFDGPARAISCAREIVERVPELGLEVRAGIHTGECERVGEKLAGLAVSVGARVSADPGQIYGFSVEAVDLRRWIDAHYKAVHDLSFC